MDARSLTRRDFLRLAATGGALALATACGAPATPAVAPTSGATAPAAQPTSPPAAPTPAAAPTQPPAPTAAPSPAAAPTAAVTAPPAATAAGATPAAPSTPAAAAPTAVAAAGQPTYNMLGASTASATISTHQGGKLIIGSGGSYEQTDPQRVLDLQNALAQRLYTAGFMDYDDKLQPIPGIVDKWDVSADGLTYTLHLRDGVKWTNGRAITMDDLVWNVNRMIDLRGVSGSGPSYQALEKEGVKPLDKSTLKLTLTHPFAPFVNALAVNYSSFLIAPESPTMKQGNDTIVTLAIGTGPYELTEYKPKEVLRLRLFKDNYRGIKDGFDEIELRNLADDQVRISALRAGDVDFVVMVPDSEIDRLQSQEKDKIETFISPEGIFWVWSFNQTRPPFDNPKVRQAALLAHDRKQIADAVTLGHGSPYEQPFTKNSRWHYDGVSLPERDVAKAKQLLAEAGHASDVKAKVLIASAWYASMRPASQVLQAQLAEAGIQIEIEDVEFGTYIDRIYKPFDYDMLGVGWEIESYDPDDYYFNGYHPKGPSYPFDGGYKNDQVIKLCEQGQAELDFAKRKAIYQQIEKLVIDDAAIIPSYRLSLGFAWRTSFKGFKPSVRGDFAHATGGIFGLTRV